MNTKPKIKTQWVLGGCALLLLLTFAIGTFSGAYAISFEQWWGLLTATAPTNNDGAAAAQLVFFNIRLPRLLLGLAAGMGLGVAGTLMQGLFRNPLADPGLIGVSAGAALAAGVTIVLGSALWPQLPRQLGSWTLVLMAMGGGFGVTLLVYWLTRGTSGIRMVMMLLAGIAVNALAGAGLGLLNMIANDEQLRSLQFWLMGSLSGARWSAVILVAAVVLLSCLAAATLATPLNIIALGEAQAMLLGVDIERVKRRAIIITAAAVGAITATTGIIGFIGLIAPHWVRMAAGPNHRLVLPGSALLGAALVLAADTAARTVIAPAELPLGVLTALIGAPMFLLMLRRFRQKL